MSENKNPEVLAEEELDAVAGGGCCSDEGSSTPCVLGHPTKDYSESKCEGCAHWDISYNPRPLKNYKYCTLK
jgi:hypothetical protein